MIDTKLLLISHVSDPDGITPVILASLVFNNFETKLIEPKDVDETLLESLDNYDEIHIVDLNMSYKLALKINEDENLKSKIRVFDHHISGIKLNEFSFVNVVNERNGKCESGTSLYYEYLCKISDEETLKKKSTQDLVNYVRSIDTYDFNEVSKEDASKIDILFSVFGKEDYIKHFLNFIKENDEFVFSNVENLLINLEKNKMKRYIEAKEKEMLKVKLDNYNVGIVYAERYRSDLGNFLASKYDELDFIIIINISKSISYRGIDKVDLSTFSKKYNGGGHKNASGSPIYDGFLKDITKLLYKNIEFLEEKDGIDESNS